MMFNSPKNFKRGRLINNRYRPIDLIIAIVTSAISIVMMLAYLLGFQGRNIAIILILLIPAVVAITLIMPMAIYHNLLEFLKVISIFNNSKKKYIWEGIYKEDILEQ